MNEIAAKVNILNNIKLYFDDCYKYINELYKILYILKKIIQTINYNEGVSL